MKLDTVVIGELDRHLLANGDSGSGYVKDTRDNTGWHPSELGGCERCLVLEKSGVLGKASPVSSVGRRIFDVGHHFGYMMQSYFYDMGILLGEWKCRVCKHIWEDLDNPSPRICPNCGQKLRIWINLDYREVPISVPEYDIKGHGDALILARSRKRLVELKTIKSRTVATPKTTDCFEDLNAPVYHHLLQLNLYLFGKGIEDGIFLYGCKNDQKIREFPIKLLENLYVTPQLEKIKRMNEHISNKTVPARELDRVKSAGECRWCDLSELCFSVVGWKLSDFIK